MRTQFGRAAAIGLIGALGLFGSACKEQQNLLADVSVVGVYTLVSVNGKEVPATVSHDGATLEVRSGTFVIKADGTCTSTMRFVPPRGTEVVREVSAKYTIDGSKLTMKWEGAGTTIGTVEGDTFTMDNEGMVLVYGK